MENFLGVFQAANKKGGFTQEDEKVLKKLSPLIAIAIEKALFINRLEMLRSIEKTILDNIMEGIALVDLSLKIREINASFIEMLGFRYTEKEVVGKDITELIPGLSEFRKKLEFVAENRISEEIFIGVMRVKIIPVDWKRLHTKEIKYIALVFSFPVGKI
ncbi:MAG: PAS domain-containing protein [Persephonella sp.]|nr:PAS domain-containing protein [Persephonella sp.]